MQIDKYISVLIQRFFIEFEKNDRSGVYAFTQRLMAYNSNKIEGSRLSKEQTASIFETGTLTDEGEIIRTKDVEEMTGHFLMFNEMLQNYDKPLTEDMIKLFHYKLKSGVFHDRLNGYAVGEYKKRENHVSTIKTTLPQNVVLDMKQLMEWYNSIETPSLEDLAKFHAKYEKIHPFQDGNGRTGRIILMKECLKWSIVPIIISDDNKAEYYHALLQAQTKENYSLLISLFKKEQNEYYDSTKGYLFEYNEEEQEYHCNQ